MKKALFKYIILLFAVYASAQSNMDNVLKSIKTNNKTIQSTTQYWNAQKLQYRTGIFLANPTVEFDYLKGSPANAGNQTDFAINQSFDFPTSYSKKKQLGEQQMVQADLQLSGASQEILFESQQILIELVYRNKLQIPLDKRKQLTEKWLSNFQKRLKQGDGNILDVNKAELQLIEIKKKYSTNVSEIARLQEQLTSLNGGEALVFNDTVYFAVPAIPDFETLEKEIEENDPLKKVLQQEKVLAEKQVEVSKAMTYPKMEIGYHYQGILGQTYSGVHTGISIPLWENKNTVKFQKARSSYADTQLTEHANEHYFEIKQLYGRYKNLKSILADYRNTMTARENMRLLDKAFSLGHLSTLEYFQEVSYYNAVFDTYMETEREYFMVIAQLYKFRLLE